MLIYPARIQPDGGLFFVSFPDIPEALTQGDTYEEALENAADALLTAMDFYFEDRRTVPDPSPIGKGMEPISLPASTSAKVLVLNQMIRTKTSAAELARKLNTSPQSVTRIVDLKHKTKIDQIAEAVEAMGGMLVFSVTTPSKKVSKPPAKNRSTRLQTA